MTKVIILAAGQGTRLLPYTKDLPKCMVEICGKPLIEFQIEVLRSCGIRDINLVVGYESQKLESYGIPMYKNDKLYLLISDLSEHTKNITINHKVSIYFSLKELNKTKSNNPRLTINGIVKKNVFKKDDKEFIDLLSAYAKIESGSKMWGIFTDFNFYSLDPHSALYVEGFGKAYQKNYQNDKSDNLKIK